MKITTPAVARVHVATRYRSDFILDETTLDVRVNREDVTPVYALRPTTATLLDYDFQTAKRLRATAASAALLGLAVVVPVVYSGVGLWFVARDLYRSVVENIRDGFVAGTFVMGEILSGLRTTLGAIVNP